MKHVRDDPTNCVLLFEDEGTFYRQPSQAWLWARRGRSQPRMRYSHRANTRMRVVAYLNAATGGVHSEEMSSVTVQRLAGSLAQLSRWYPDAKTIYLVWDNWPNHTHPKVTRALSSQARVRVLPLPTYAPWLNPMEKGWRWTRQRVSHAHPWCDDFSEFRQQVRSELARLSQGSEEFLRYIGLSI
jgi:transposase